MSERIFVDPELCGHARRFIITQTIRRPRRHVHLVLDRDSYVDCWPELGRAVCLSPSLQAALERCVEAGQLRLWVSDGINAKASVWDRYVTLVIPEARRNEAIEALRVAELEGRLEPLEALTVGMAVPLEDWLAPGPHVFQRGVDFTCSATKFLFLLKTEADRRGDRRVVGKQDGDAVTVDVTFETKSQWLLRNSRRLRRRAVGG